MEIDNNLMLKDVLQLSEDLFEPNIESEQRKALIERAIRSKALKFGGTVPRVPEVSAFVAFVVNLAKQEICSKTITIQIMQDIFDVSSVNCCEPLFGIVEDNIDKWKTPFFFDSCKNLVLRMCNDLLKRLSRTVNTTFCGRILILLANFLPFAEKSGLNLTGQFNTHNVTTYDQEKKDQPFDEMNQQLNMSTIAAAVVAGDDDVEVGEIREHRDVSGAIPVDYNLYVKFWDLQNFFANPNLLFEYNAFKNFHEVLSEFLIIFSSNPAITGLQQQNQFFAKYLTSQKLFPLQLADSQFRRYFMLQYLIIANYLLLKVKLKDNFTLTALQEEEVRELSEKCFALLRDTHPNGSLFADAVKKVLSRERLWSAWKNEGCPDLISPLLNAQNTAKYAAFKRKTLCQVVPGQMDLGNRELTRLWNIQPNNLLACEEQQRNCAPDLVKFLSEALDQMDPAQQVEEQYQCVNEEKYQWRGSRFLLLTSDQYLSSNAQDSSRLPSSTASSTISTSTAFFLKKTIQMTAENVPALKERTEQIQLAIKKKENAERTRLAAEAKELEKLEKKAAVAAAAVTDKKRGGGGDTDTTTTEKERKQREDEQQTKELEKSEKRAAGDTTLTATTDRKRGGGGDTATTEKERKQREDEQQQAKELERGDTTTTDKKRGGGDTAAAATTTEKERKQREDEQSADRRIKRRRERGAEKPKKRRTEEENGTNFV